MADPGNSLVVARRVMYELLGRRWIDPPIRAVETYRTHADRVWVQGRPILVVNSVTVDGDEIVDFDVFNNGVIELPDEKRLSNNLLFASTGWTWTGRGAIGPHLLNLPVDPRKVIVDYTYGTGTPEYVSNAIEMLAAELEKALAGDDSCRLNSRVTSVTSRGIDMTMLDAESFLENGYTGIPEVDLAIRTLNAPRAKKRARVHSPAYRPGRRHQREGS